MSCQERNCLLPEGHVGPHQYDDVNATASQRMQHMLRAMDAEPPKDIQAIKHLDLPKTASDLLKDALDLMARANERFLPGHTREHVLAAFDLLTVARAELALGDDAPCIASCLTETGKDPS